MSVLSMKNWNFHNINGVTCLTGVVKKQQESFFSITEEEIKDVNCTTSGLFIKSIRGEFFCRYEDVGVRHLPNVSCRTTSRIIKDVCYFEKTYLQKSKSVKNLIEHEDIVSYESKVVKPTDDNFVIKKLVKGLHSKFKRNNDLLEDNSCIIFLEPTGLCTYVAVKINGCIFLDDYASIVMQEDSLEVSHDFQGFKINYVISEQEITVTELPSIIENVCFMNSDNDEDSKVIEFDDVCKKVVAGKATIQRAI